MSEERTRAERVKLARKEAQALAPHDPLCIHSEEVTRLRIRSISGETGRTNVERYSELLRLVDEMVDKAIREGIGTCVPILRTLHMEHHRLTNDEQNRRGEGDSG